MQRLIQTGAAPVTWEARMAELGRFDKDGYDMGRFIKIMNDHLSASGPAA